MKKIIWSQLSKEEQVEILKRPAQKKGAELAKTVSEIISTVRSGGDQALMDYTERFDGVKLSSLEVSRDEMTEADLLMGPLVHSALKSAFENIYKFHKAQIPENIEMEVSPGIRLEKRFLPIESVGLYVPGGTAVLPSTVLMLAIPSAIAGCKQRILCTPPMKNGKVHPAILAAARLCGIERIYKVGGAQAIAALAYGTETIPKVDKIFGPGNSYVTEAKTQVACDSDGAAIDMPAGPSEVMVINDGSAPASFAAADLLSQAEHGTDSQVVLACTDPEVMENILREVELQLGKLPRAEIARVALSSSLAIETRDLKEAIAIANRYAPEHLILQTRDPGRLSKEIKNAGSLFLGPWTPEAAGDYASGTNHVLPTYGYARSTSGLGTSSFMRSMTVQELSADGIAALGPTIETLAQCEGLMAHSEAVSVRLRTLNKGATK